MVFALLLACLIGWTQAPFYPPKPPVDQVIPLPKTNLGLYFPNCDGSGRYLVFNCFDPAQIPDDRNGCFDLVVYDLQTDMLARASVNNAGKGGNQNTFEGRLSADGRFVVFGTTANNLVPGDTNNNSDIFLRDRQAGVTARVSVAPKGVQANGPSFTGAVSRDGRYIAFTTRATNLGGHPGTQFPVYLRDTIADTTTFIGRGMLQLRMTPDANYVLTGFPYEDGGVIRYNRKTGESERANVTPEGGLPNNVNCGDYAISDDGRYVVFATRATNITPDCKSGRQNVYVRDMQEKTTVCISHPEDGSEADGDSGVNESERITALAFSGDGRWVVFASTATNLVPDDTNGVSDIFLYDIPSEKLTCVSVDVTGKPKGGIFPAVNADGSYIFYLAGQENGRGRCMHALIRKPLPPIEPSQRRLKLPTYTPLMTGADGAPLGGTVNAAVMSDDGRYTAYAATATGLPGGATKNAAEVYLTDRATKQTVRVSSAPNGDPADRPSGEKGLCISGDGRWVAYASAATNLVPGDTNFREDVFLYETTTGKTTRASLNAAGEEANGMSRAPSLSRDGRYLAFVSTADNLAATVTDGGWHVFVKDLKSGAVACVDMGIDGKPADDVSALPAISGEGACVAFVSLGTNLVAGGDGRQHVYLYDFRTKKLERISVTGDCTPGDDLSTMPAVSFDGRYVGFISKAGNLVPGGNGKPTVYLRDRKAGATVRISAGPDGAASGTSGYFAMSPDARWFAFVSDGVTFTEDGGNGKPNLFRYDRETKQFRCLTPKLSGKFGAAASLRPALTADGRLLLLAAEAAQLQGAKFIGRTLYACECAAAVKTTEKEKARGAK
jgi:Tol biopolymer transport system component